MAYRASKKEVNNYSPIVEPILVSLLYQLCFSVKQQQTQAVKQQISYVQHDSMDCEEHKDMS